MTGTAGHQAGLWFERSGQGPDLLLLHGWSMHSEIWSFFKDALSEHFRVTTIDLPGHGRSHGFKPESPADFSNRILDIAPEGTIAVGWSLGGLLLLDSLSRSPSHFGGAVLIASSPKFSRGLGWPGVSHAALAGMEESLQEDYGETLRRFVSLQTLGQAGARDLSKSINDLLNRQPAPAPWALQWGLSVLAHADFRDQVSRSALPMLAILGARDRLIPAQVAEAFSRLNPQIQVLLLKDAAHIPFLTHSAEVCEAIVRFAHDCKG